MVKVEPGDALAEAETLVFGAPAEEATATRKLRVVSSSSDEEAKAAANLDAIMQENAAPRGGDGGGGLPDKAALQRD